MLFILEQHKGSYMSAASLDFATAAWLLEDSHFPHQNLCCSITHVSGPPADANAYDMELQGLHALLLAIKGLCSLHTVTSGSIVVGCDNLGALHQAQQIQMLTPCPCQSHPSYPLGPSLSHRSHYSLYA